VKAVHQTLDLVGWYSLVPKSGPTASHLPIHNQILQHNESAILLGFHIEDLLHPTAGDPLPITIYESNLEADDSNRDTADGEDKEMKDPEAATKMILKFRVLPSSTETGEVEMIAMQFIREGGANASSGSSSDKRVPNGSDKQKAVEGDAKGKRRAVPQDEADQGKAAAVAKETNPDADLSREEIEFLSALQAKANAVRMMKSRVDLIVAYLAKLPTAFVSGQQSTSEAASSAQANGFAVPSNNILRQIQALVTNIHLVTPAEQDKLEEEIRLETNDVRLIGLISDLMSSVSSVREVGKKFAAVESSKNVKARQRADYGHTFNDVDPMQLGSSAGDLFT
jgi:COP9 signalosome complex subunit 6